MLGNKSTTGTRSLDSRVLRYVIPLIMVVFLLMALLSLVGLRARSRDVQEEDQRSQLTELSFAISAQIDQVAGDTRRLAASLTTRQFAYATIVGTTGSSFQEIQDRLLSEFTNLLQQSGGAYLAARYVTSAGAVWSEVSNYDGTGMSSTTGVRLDEQSGSPELEAALSTAAGQVYVSPVGVRRDPERPSLPAIAYVRFAVPVFGSDALGSATGVIQIDVLGNILFDGLVETLIFSAAQSADRRLLVVDSNGQVIGDSATPDYDYVALQTAGEPLATLTNRLPEIAAAVAETPDSRAPRDIGGSLVTSFNVAVGTADEWRLIVVEPLRLIGTREETVAVAAFVTSLVLGVLLSFGVAVVTRRALQPVKDASLLAQQWTQGEAIASAPVLPADDDVGQMVVALQTMSERVRGLTAALESRSVRRARDLQMAAQLSRETAALRDLDDLLQRALRLICDEFGYYHAQVFLIDDIGLNIVLIYRYNDAPLDQRKPIPLASDLLVAQVAREGRALVVNDVLRTEYEPGQFEALLPDTRAQMLLPLYYGERVIGVLDMQSLRPDSFGSDETEALGLLADQIGIALESTRTLLRAEERIQQADTLNRQLTRTAWEAEIGQDIIYRYDLLRLERVEPHAVETTPNALSMPIRVRGEVIGTLEAAAPAQGFTAGDQAVLRAVADRVAIAIENARLFEETQVSLSETSTLYQLNRTLNEADSLEGIVEAIVTTVMPDASGGQIGVFDDYPANGKPDWIEIAADWSRSGHLTQSVHLVGVQLQLADHPVLWSMNANQIVLIRDTQRDSRLDDVLRAILSDTHAQALVIIPFSVRTSWRGLILIQFPQVREFTERDGRIYNALIDQAGVAIDNRMLLQENELALEQIERLYSASRIINMAQNLQELIRAAISTASDPNYNFELGVFEGELDATGWPTRLRIIARSEAGEVVLEDTPYEMLIPGDSPLRHREPQIAIDRNLDLPTESSMIRMIREREHRFAAAFPLFSANMPIALFIIVGAEIRELSPDDYDVYRALTSQMSTVLQNRRLLEQTEAALDETRRLYAASRAITSAPDLQSVYQAAAGQLALSLPTLGRVGVLLEDIDQFECVYLWQREAVSNDDLRIAPELQVGDRLSAAQFPLDELIHDQVGSRRFDQVSSEMTEWPQLRALLSGEGSAIIAVLQTRQRRLGALVCESEMPRAFDEQYQRFVQALAAQVAVAIEGLQLFEEAQLQAQRALALAEAGQLTSRIGSEFDRNISEVFARVAEPASYDRWLLALADDSGQRLEIITRAVPGVHELAITQDAYFDIDSDRNSIVDAYLNNRMLLVNTPSSYPAYVGAPTEMLETIGKHISAPVRIAGRAVGVLLVGRGLASPDLDDNDEQLVRTLAAQVSIAVENQRLYRAAQVERETLRSILETLPAGVLVLDPLTFRPVQFNQQVERLLGRSIDPALIFTTANYNLYRTNTDDLYPDDTLPITVAAETGRQAYSDDLVAHHSDGTQIDLLLNAAPILDARGRVAAVVAAFQDITALRSLENTLQQNLRETITLYESTRALAEAAEIDDVLDQAFLHLNTLLPSELYILLLDDEREGLRVVRSLTDDGVYTLPEDILDAEQPLIISDVAVGISTAAAYVELDVSIQQALLERGVRSLVSTPLRARSRRDMPLGWMVLTFDHAQYFSPEREQFFITLTDNTAIALDNRYLFRSTQIALRETAALYEATTGISRVRSDEQLAETLHSALAALSPDVAAGYWLQAGELTLLFQTGQDALTLPIDGFVAQQHQQKRATVYIEDTAALDPLSPLTAEVAALDTLRALALVQLRAKEMPGGYLFIGFQEPRRFSEGDVRYLSAIADSASVVVDNILLLDQIRSTLDETRVLYQASRDLSNAVVADEIMQIVVNYLLYDTATSAFMGMLSTSSWERADTALNVVSAWHLEDEPLLDMRSLTLTAQYPGWSVLASPSVLLIDDLETTDALTAEEAASLMTLDLRAAAVLPLTIRKRAIGVLVIGSREPHIHTERDMRVFRAFAEQLSLRLEATRLVEQTERRARQLATSAEVSQIASAILDLDSLLPRIVNLIRERFGYDHTQIFLMDEDDDYAELRASTGEPGRQLLAIRHKLQKGSMSVIGQVAARGEPVIAADTSESGIIHRPNPYLPNTRSELALPLKIKGRVVGALDVQSNQPNAFDDDDVAVLTTLAAQISVAIDNARLFSESSSRASEMSFLFSVTTTAASAQTLSEALGKVAQEVRDSLDALSATIYLPEQFLDADENLITIMRPVALAGLEQPLSEVSEVRLDTSNSLIASAANERRPIIVGLLETMEGYVPIAFGARSAIIVPLTSANQLIGLIALESAEPNAYDNDALTLLLTLSGTLSAIIQNQKLLEQMQRTNEQLLELDRLKSDFLANMSHELRTPLNSIIGFSRVILKGIDGPLTEMQEQDLSTIYNSGQHLLNLINDILDQAKIAAGKMDLQKDYFEIKAVIDGVRSIGIGLVKDKPIDIFVDLASGLPKAFGDEFRTRQVLLNLISNAAKFTREGSIHIRVRLFDDDELERRMIRVDVTDTGIGIAEKDIPLLFEAFRQVDSSLTRTVGGTGLGLPIARSLVELQGGRMIVESQVNVGSTFSVLIPIEPAEEEDGSPKKTDKLRKKTTGGLTPVNTIPAPKSNGSTGPLGMKAHTPTSGLVHETTETTPMRPPPQQTKRQILIIEDNPDMVDQLRRALQREGFDIFSASIPLEAEAMASGLHPTIIIMDVNFANGGGWNILSKLKDRDDTCDIPVIVVSLSSESERILGAGAFRHIQRPFMPETLVEAVQQAEAESRVDRILIIDDQPESVRLLEELLSHAGHYRIFSAHSGYDGIALVARRRPDLVILDLRMPEMDGFQVVQELRGNPETATIPILIVTGEILTAEERQRLESLHVMYKAEISADDYRQFLDGVRSHLLGNGE